MNVNIVFAVICFPKKKMVGRLDQMFVGEIRPEYGKERAKPFILRGNPWQTVAIDDEKGVVYVEPIFEKTNFKYIKEVKQVIRLLGLLNEEDLKPIYGTSQEKSELFHRQKTVDHIRKK